MTVETLDGMDVTRRLTRISFNQTPAQKMDACEDAGQALEYALNVASLALSAEGVGGMQWILDTAVAYAKSREQYGHLIGSYQAVSHPLVDRTLDLTSARSAVYNAAYALDHQPDETREAVSMAKALVSDSYRQTGYTGVQTLGGIGFTWEHDMQLYFRRASGSWSLFGDPIWHRERLLQSLRISERHALRSVASLREWAWRPLARPDKSRARPHSRPRARPRRTRACEAVAPHGRWNLRGVRCNTPPPGDRARRSKPTPGSDRAGRARYRESGPHPVHTVRVCAHPAQVVGLRSARSFASSSALMRGASSGSPANSPATSLDRSSGGVTARARQTPP